MEINTDFFLMSLKDVHLSTMLFENREGKRTLTYALVAIGLIIIVMVSINYTNLATVLTFSRAKEVGIRKVTGGRSAYLFQQFIVESILICIHRTIHCAWPGRNTATEALMH